MILVFTVTPFRADRVEIINKDGERIVYLHGGVEIKQDGTNITCRKAQLNETKGIVLLEDSVQIKDNMGEIKANTATYFLKERFSVLKGNVELISENQIIYSDSLEYDGAKRFIRMFGNIILEDRKNKVVAYGTEGWYDLKEETGRLMKGPKLELSRQDKSPIIIHAREFLLKNKENNCYGYDSVMAIIDSITLFCDTISFDIKTHRGSITKPLVVEKKNELKGISGEFVLKDKTIDYFKVKSGIAHYWAEDGSQNIIEGESIAVLFKEGRAFQVRVEGKPKGKLYPKEKKEGATD
ncbi:MAG: LptA/OstA family protein [candidate division WOR-3 bacterium]|nr:LptA/OstA family protein [candidate division WOR-3 bacterium]